MTKYERDNKILDVPKFQETTLSNLTTFSSFDCLPMDCCYDIQDRTCLPDYIKRDYKQQQEEERNKKEEEQFEKLFNITVDYCDALDISSLEELKIYLKYVLMCAWKDYTKINFDKLFSILNRFSKELVQNEIQKLLAIFYIEINQKNEELVKKIFEFLNKDYQKVVLTGMVIDIFYDNCTKKEYQKALYCTVDEVNIDRVLEIMLLKLDDVNSEY